MKACSIMNKFQLSQLFVMCNHENYTQGCQFNYYSCYLSVLLVHNLLHNNTLTFLSRGNFMGKQMIMIKTNKKMCSKSLEKQHQSCKISFTDDCVHFSESNFTQRSQPFLPSKLITTTTQVISEVPWIQVLGTETYGLFLRIICLK